LRDVGLNSNVFLILLASPPILNLSCSFFSLKITIIIISFRPSNFFLISISVISPDILAFLQKPSALRFSLLYISHCFNILLYISFSFKNFIRNDSAFRATSSSNNRNPSTNSLIDNVDLLSKLNISKSLLHKRLSKFQKMISY
jgi:hypothetical protein